MCCVMVADKTKTERDGNVTSIVGSQTPPAAHWFLDRSSRLFIRISMSVTSILMPASLYHDHDCHPLSPPLPTHLVRLSKCVGTSTAADSQPLEPVWCRQFIEG